MSILRLIGWCIQCNAIQCAGFNQSILLSSLVHVLCSAVCQELVLPKSGIDGSYRCSISPYLRPISFGPTIPSILLSLFWAFSSATKKACGGTVLWCTAASVFVSKTAKVSVFRCLGWERVRWHFRSHTAHMTSDTLLSDVRYQIYVFPETGCFCIPGKSWNSLMWQFRFRQEPSDPPVSVERYEICVFLETCGFLDWK